MENINNKTWNEWKKESDKELKEKDAPYKLVPTWFWILSWISIVVLLAFLISMPILVYEGKFQSLINNTINLEPEINNTVNNNFDNDYNPTTNNKYEHVINTTIYNNIIIPDEVNCNCS